MIQHDLKLYGPLHVFDASKILIGNNHKLIVELRSKRYSACRKFS